MYNRNDGDKIDGAFAGPLRRSVGDPRDGQTVPDSYRMSNEDVLHEKSFATTALEPESGEPHGRRGDGEETKATSSSARRLCSRVSQEWIAEDCFVSLGGRCSVLAWEGGRR